MPINAGHFGERITLQQRESGVDSHGQESTTWATVANVWAQVQPLRGREFFAAGQVQAQIDIRIRIRYRAGIVPTMRVYWRDQSFDIISVINVEAGRDLLELMCSTGARDGR